MIKSTTQYHAPFQVKTRRMATLCFMLIALPFTSRSQATASNVLGQTNMTGNTSGTTAISLNIPMDAAYDLSGNLYVADYSNNRVMIYKNVASKANGAAADYVLGQTNFTSNASAITASRLSQPTSVTVDATGNLYVSDNSNNRILIFKNIRALVNANALTNGAAATYVIGQPNFTTNTAGTFSNVLSGPVGTAVDASGNLYVADGTNNRVLIFNGVENAVNNSTLATSLAASKVLGQANYTSSGTGLTSTSMNGLWDVAVSTAGDMYVADANNNRVLIFRNVTVKANGAAADVVLGQPNFTTSTGGAGLNAMTAPLAITVLGGNGPLDVADADNNRILIFQNPQSATNGQAASKQIGGTGTTAAGTLAAPFGLAYSATEGLWIAEAGNNRVVKYATVFALPIKLTDFNATSAGSHNVINWQSGTETDGCSYEIERGGNGSSFIPIGEQKGKAIAGSYFFYDEQPLSPVNYYRLKMKESNGEASYSSVAIVRYDGKGGSITVSPVPAVSSLTITSSDALLNGQTALICNMQGQVMRTFAIGSVVNLDISSWAAGNYMLRLPTGEVIRIVKQ